MNGDKVVRGAFAAITAFLIVLMVALTLGQVVNRYGVHAPLDWTEELARLALVYLTFLGSVVALQRREHLKIDTVVRLLPPVASRWLRIAVDLVSVGVLATVVWVGLPTLPKFWGVLSAALNWPTTLFYFPVVFGCLVLMIYTARDVVVAIRGGDTPPDASA